MNPTIKHTTPKYSFVVEYNMKAAATTINDVLLLAQQKLDEFNREDLGLSSTAFGRRGHRRKGIITLHLLSTHLCCSILSYKLEDVKTMLEEEDPETYEEWRCLFETIHFAKSACDEDFQQEASVQGGGSTASGGADQRFEWIIESTIIIE